MVTSIIEEIRETKLICDFCKKDFTWDCNRKRYNSKVIRINNKQKIYCSIGCVGQSQRNIALYSRANKLGISLSNKHKQKISETRKELYGKNTSNLQFTCNNKKCNKVFHMKRWVYNHKIRNTKNIDYQPFCSEKCYHDTTKGRKHSLETIEKIRNSNLCKYKPQSGVKGHIVSDETRIKMSDTKRGISVKSDWNIVINETKKRNLTKYILTRAPIPDIIYLDDDNKLIGIELEKKRSFSDIKPKMDLYLNSDLTHHSLFYKILLVWYDPRSNEQIAEYLFENDKWVKNSGFHTLPSEYSLNSK